ncbi:hypothetical protein G6F18_008363 [Rhizopus arrhizus]|nr:hypothetical protein G6F18_008363 [Rhizopus arrhizus]
MNTDFEMIELSLQQEEEEQTTEIYVSMMPMIRSKWVTAMPSSDVMDLDEEVNEELGALDSEENNYNEDNSENENESNDKLAKPTIEEFTKKLASNNKENEKTLNSAYRFRKQWTEEGKIRETKKRGRVAGTVSDLKEEHTEVLHQEFPGLSVNEAGFSFHMTRTRGWSKKGKPAKSVVPASRAYLSNVMDVLDKNDMKGFYLVMDNAPIHKPATVRIFIEKRGYKCCYLPPYSPFLNPIELFWSKVKYGIKRSPFDTGDTLTPRIMESCSKKLFYEREPNVRGACQKCNDSKELNRTQRVGIEREVHLKRVLTQSISSQRASKQL